MIALGRFGGSPSQAIPARAAQSHSDSCFFCDANAAVWSALTVLATALILPAFEMGQLSTQMACHVGLMNVAAPLMASAWRHRIAGIEKAAGNSAGLWSATALQLVFLWGWHVPAVHHFAITSTPGLIAMHAALFLAALFFWRMVLAPRGSARWKSIVALLVTGKLACLLGVLLIFAPRLLYPAAAGHEHTLADQQFAGLIMIAACPLSYLLAGIVVAARLIKDVARLSAPIGRP